MRQPKYGAAGGIATGFDACWHGAVIGIGIALISARVLKGFVFGISTRDPLTYVVIASTIMLVALVAAALPAWRATRVSPIVALRAND